MPESGAASTGARTTGRRLGDPARARPERSPTASHTWPNILVMKCVEQLRAAGQCVGRWLSIR
eukprot:9492948-Pyramimonas_sp.AAC.1